MIIGKGRDKIVLQMYPVQYHGESQFLSSKVTSADEGHFYSKTENDSNVVRVGTDLIHMQEKGMVYQCSKPNAYVVYPEDTMNFDYVIAD